MVARDNCDSGRDFAQRLGIRTGGGEGEQAYLLIHSEAQAAALVDYFFSPLLVLRSSKMLFLLRRDLLALLTILGPSL